MQITKYSPTNIWLGIPDGEGRWLSEKEIDEIKKCFRCDYTTLDKTDYVSHLKNVHHILI